jgi:hypothetical protein
MAYSRRLRLQIHGNYLAMNYAHVISHILDALKDEDNIPAAYRNALISDGRRWQMQILGAQTLTNRVPQDQFNGQASTTREISQDESICTCTELGRRKDCPVHGSV